MDALEMLRKRRSVRKFKLEPVDAKDVETVIDCARLAATARNEQPWEFVVVTDAAARGRIAFMTDYGKFIAEAPVCVCVFCKDTKYYLEDGSAATQNILLAAHALGLGTCWVAGDKKPYCGKMAEMLGLPEGYRLVSLVALGHPNDAGAQRSKKRPLEEVLHWEKF